MDWTPQIEMAKSSIAQFGAPMSLITAIPGVYNATTDTIATTIATYSVIGLIKNPTVQRANGEYGKSDRVRLLISAKGLPTNLEDLEFHIIYGTIVWHPDITTALKPGGVPILFTIDMR